MTIRDRGRPLWPAGDVPSRHYVVLGGISPGYPSVTGRFHTCYSPVRRSPAGVSKLATPLPLDLHVLSLSLAFILSQDQTLRCCYLVFFLSKDGARAPRTTLPNSVTRHGTCLRFICGWNMTGSFFSPRRSPGGRLLYYSSCLIVSLSMYYFRAALPSPRKTLQNYKLVLNCASFSTVFFSSAFRRPLPGTFRHRGGTSVPESECKGRHFFITLQIFQQKSFLKSCC